MADLDEKLKPCPFCGSADIAIVPIRDGYRSHCRKCGAAGGAEFYGPSDRPSARERAIAAWNRRAYLDATQAQAPDVVEALTDQEIHFCLTVLANPGAKIRDVGDEVLFREAADGASVPSWEVAEKLGFVTCVGSYKWIPTEKLRATLRRIFAALSAPSTPDGWREPEEVLRAEVNRLERETRAAGGYMPAISTLLRVLSDEMADKYPDDTNGCLPTPPAGGSR